MPRSPSPALLAACLVVATVTVPAARSAAEDTAPVDQLLSWNQTMIQALETAKTPPPPAMRAAAIVAASVFDAVDSVTHRYTAFHVDAAAPRGTSATAAAVAAAHEALVRLFPAQQATFDSALAASVAALSDGGPPAPAVQRGLTWGAAVADATVDWRAGDGFSAAVPPYVGSPDPGRWQPTPPLFAPPAFRQFATMTPFAMTSPGQFLPGPPPALTSTRYAQDVAEVESIGRDTSAVRSAFDTQTALFFNSDVPVALYDRVADDLIARSDLSLTKAARVLALANIAMADAVISIWNAKNHYDTWRPITAIRAADTDANPATSADPTWSPLLVTPPFQEYPSGHAGVTSAAAAVLADAFGAETSFTVVSANMPGVQRSFTSFGDLTEQVVLARVLGGIHFRFADEAARDEGAAVAAYVLDTQLLPAHGRG